MKTTTEEKIKIMQAYINDEEVEFRPLINGKEWYAVTEINEWWDFAHYEYRVKPKPTLRLYESGEELLSDIRKHGNWIKDGKTYRIIEKFTQMENGTIRIQFSGMKEWDDVDIPVLQRDLRWADDNTQFGVTEE